MKETHAREILAALDGLKAVDPACGSGAYLLGLLQEMIVLYRQLYSEKLVKDARTLYDLKLRIISQSLYGVDIDPFATNIAKLRLWLSLAVEADQPVPLPNLDFKIETGDSLVAPDPQEMPDLFRVHMQHTADVVAMVKHQFFLSHGEEKEEYRKTIISQESHLRKELATEYGEGVVDWRIQFAEAFANKRGGFDIVLANPPYGIDIQGDYATRVSQRDSYACFLGLATSMSSRSAAASSSSRHHGRRARGLRSSENGSWRITWSSRSRICPTMCSRSHSLTPASSPSGHTNLPSRVSACWSFPCLSENRAFSIPLWTDCSRYTCPRSLPTSL